MACLKLLMPLNMVFKNNRFVQMLNPLLVGHPSVSKPHFAQKTWLF